MLRPVANLKSKDFINNCVLIQGGCEDLRMRGFDICVECWENVPIPAILNTAQINIPIFAAQTVVKSLAAIGSKTVS